ncbi:MAG: potassium channel family protein [Candidatus Xenobium sp.]|jgi:trk system potassium uptake protein TrkA|nr:TrkA family potassium uptake protein [Burkholderiales bacterium]
MRRQFLVVGLGRFGVSLAALLEKMGGEVLAVDRRESAVMEVADLVTSSLIADTTEERVVKDLGVENFDEVVCAIGTDVEASLMTTLLLREFGARILISKASTEMHGRLLEKIGVDRVIYPERDMAARLARDFFAPPGIEELLDLSVQHKMFQIQAPVHFHERSLADLHLRARFGMNIIAIRRGEKTIVSPSAQETLHDGDGLVVVGDYDRAQEALKKPE